MAGAKAGICGSCVFVRGDNRSALPWAKLDACNIKGDPDVQRSYTDIGTSGVCSKYQLDPSKYDPEAR